MKLSPTQWECLRNLAGHGGWTVPDMGFGIRTHDGHTYKSNTVEKLEKLGFIQRQVIPRENALRVLDFIAERCFKITDSGRNYVVEEAAKRTMKRRQP